MTDQQEPKKTGKSARPIGGINQQYATIGGKPKNFRGPDVKSPELLDDIAANKQSDIATKRFVAIEVNPQNVKTSRLQDDLTTKRQSDEALKQREDKELKRQTVYLPKRLALWLKSHAALKEQDMSDIVTMLIEDYQRREEQP